MIDGSRSAQPPVARRSGVAPSGSTSGRGEGERGDARLGIAAAVLVILVLGAWFVWPREKPDLVIVGDSVTFLSIGAIDEELRGGHDLDIRAYPGQASTDLVLVVLQELAERDGVGEGLDAIALLVGYNDVLRYRGQPDEVQELVELASGARCTVVLTVPAPPEWSDQEDLNGVRAAFAAYNDELKGAAEQHPDVQVVTDWQELVEASEPGELVDTDGVHPVAAGQQALAGVYRSAIDANC